MKKMSWSLPVAAALAVAFSTSEAQAQAKGPKGGQDRARQEVRQEREGPRFQRRQVPPGWCQGRGNPHNTAANCGSHTDRIYRDRDGVWRDRDGRRIERDGIYRDIEGILRDRTGRRLN